MKRQRNRQLRVSRTLLIVVGLLLGGVAVVAGLLAAGTVERLSDQLDSDTVVLNEPGRTMLSDHELAFQLGAFGVGLVLVLVGWFWVAKQLPPRRHQQDATVSITDDPVEGTTTVNGDALATALVDDLERAEQIRRARVELRPGDEVARLRLDITDGTDVDELLASVVSPAIDRIVKVAELSPRPQLQLDLRPVGPGERVVH